MPSTELTEVAVLNHLSTCPNISAVQQLHLCPQTALVAQGYDAYTAAPTAELLHTQGSSDSWLPITQPGKHSWAGNLKDLRLLNQQSGLMGNCLPRQKKELQRTCLLIPTDEAQYWRQQVLVQEEVLRPGGSGEALEEARKQDGTDSEWHSAAQIHICSYTPSPAHVTLGEPLHWGGILETEVVWYSTANLHKQSLCTFPTPPSGSKQDTSLALLLPTSCPGPFGIFSLHKRELFV